MSDLFHDFRSIDYPVVDADAHVNEPPNLWQDRVPAKWKARAPKLEHTDKGDLWLFDEGREKWPVGLTATAGLSNFQLSPTGGRYSEMRPGSFEVEARLEDMDIDGIHAQILYPSVTLKGARIYSEEPELQLACVRAYNEWIGEFCEGASGRLAANAIVPTTGVADALAELEWAIKNDHRGAVISAFPNGSLDPKEEDEPFWALAQESGMPVAIHIGGFLPPSRKAASQPNPGALWTGLRFVGRAAWTKAGGQTFDAVCDVLFSGIFERFPRLKVVLVESNIGWIPTLCEQADDMFARYRFYTEAYQQMSSMPSEVFHRNFWATFVVDTVGVELRHRMNLRHIMWSSDYPHSGCDWPDSRLTIERMFKGVPQDEVKQMLHANCRDLYRLDIPDHFDLEE